MSSKAQKLRNKKNNAGKYTKSGQLSRAKEVVREAERLAAEQTEKEALSVGIGARMRHYNCNEENAKHSATGYVLGRLLSRGRINIQQHDAGFKFAIIRAGYLQAIECKRVRAASLGSQGGSATVDEELEIARHERAVRIYDDAVEVLKHTDTFKCKQVLIKASDDQELTEHDLLILGFCLTALHRHFSGS